MINIDNRGARASNAGDDYHELWTLRKALFLLDQDTDLYSITVEGLRIEDESGTFSDTWDGVDCALYYGDKDTQIPTKIVIAQLKYSSTNPKKVWSIDRLTYSSKKIGNNSIIRQLAKAYAGMVFKFPDLAKSGKIIIQFISNQPINPEVTSTISELIKLFNKKKNQSYDPANEKLKKASGLNQSDYKSFLNALDFSFCSGDSRFSLEEKIISEISNLIEDDARTIVNQLLREIRRKMMPEAKGDQINREVVLSWMGCYGMEALFPCPSEIKQIFPLVKRKIAETIVNEIVLGKQFLCIHGEGGCGKSVLIQELKELLPTHSILIEFDCYGGGRYLDADAFRHRPQDAFLQLANDLAIKLKTPLLINRSMFNSDYPRKFKKRVIEAAEIIEAIDVNAKLVIAIDAADNSIIAANNQTIKEKSFINDFVSIGDIPKNVSFILTTRTGRLNSLNLPAKYLKIKIDGFTKMESSIFLNYFWENIPDSWIADFHYLSRGNPRVQTYAINYSSKEKENALALLRPDGKLLGDIFKAQLLTAQQKTGYDIKLFCTGIISLPCPIPIKHFASIIELNEDQVLDICSDLAPGIVVEKNSEIRIADEDFESYLREEADPSTNSINERIADYFQMIHREDSYAASHYASALFAANRKQDILNLVDREKEPSAISDPLLRREVQLQRLRIAMKVCRESKNDVDAILTFLNGAEASKTDSVIKKMLTDNPDLAINFAGEKLSRYILSDPSEIRNHGRFLFQFLAFHAKEGDGISVREGQRQLAAWLQKRKENHQDQENSNPDIPPKDWLIEYDDIVAETEAILRTRGPKEAISQSLNWKPKSVALYVAMQLSFKLIVSNDLPLVEQCLDALNPYSPWRLFILVPLAISGVKVDLDQMGKYLEILFQRGFIDADKLKNLYDKENTTVLFLETILTACEILASNNRDCQKIIPILERLSNPTLRQYDSLHTSQTNLIDISLRAFLLVERLNNLQPSFDTFLIEPLMKSDDPKQEDRKREEIRNLEKKQELTDFIKPLFDIYDVRSQILISKISIINAIKELRKVIILFNKDNYRFDGTINSLSMRRKLASSISRLLFLLKDKNLELFKISLSIIDKRQLLVVDEVLKVLRNFAIDQMLHPQIINKVISIYQHVKRKKISSDEKIDELVNLARFLLPISRDDAKVIYDEAFKVSDDINYDSIYQISLLKSFSYKAKTQMDVMERREVAKNFSIVVNNAGLCLSNYDYFPWSDAAQILANLDLPFSLAVAARWHDENVIKLSDFLPGILNIALSENETSLAHIISILTFIDNCDDDFMCRIVDKVHRVNTNRIDNVFKILSKDELLRFGKGIHCKVNRKISTLSTDNKFYKTWLEETTKFHTEETYKSFLNSEIPELTKNIEVPLFEEYISGVDLFQEGEISKLLSNLKEVNQRDGVFISNETILSSLRDVIQVKDRKSYLEAICKIDNSHITGYELGIELLKCAEIWAESLSVTAWFENNLLPVLIERFNIWPHYDNSLLSNLFAATHSSDSKICEGLLESLERHVDVLDAPTIYQIVGLLGKYISSNNASKIMSRYVGKLLEKIASKELEEWIVDDIPSRNSEAFARFLYAFLGDFDKRIRWRAAHSVLRLAQLGETETISEITKLYDLNIEKSFRDPQAPFYWLAARLWLIVALDRIASEFPEAISEYSKWLLEIAIDDKFPHVIIQSFAKSAVLKTVEKGYVTFDEDSINKLNNAITGFHKKRSSKSKKATFNINYFKNDTKERKFHFDAMDTLPYWYEPALRTFEDVKGEKFLDVAESWIVHRWNAGNGLGRWDDEPRKNSYGSKSYMLMMHDHGSEPIIERFHTYLEWHAMWCTIGELLKDNPIVRDSNEVFYTYESLLNEQILVYKDIWLSDLLSPKPLEKQFWLEPQKVETWIDLVNESDFLNELLVSREKNFVVISGYHDTRSENYRSTIRVNSAFVSPKPASALVRALQTEFSSWDFKIPPFGDECEINQSPYKLLGWLLKREKILGIEETDSFRNEVRRIEVEPSEDVIKEMDLSIDYDESVSWKNNVTGKTVFIYKQWGDDPSGEKEYESRYISGVHSEGWRLLINRESLMQILNESGFDLLLDVEITRSNKGNEYSRYDEKAKKESIFDKIILFRKDGTIETTNGCIGTWMLPSR